MPLLLVSFCVIPTPCAVCRLQSLETAPALSKLGQHDRGKSQDCRQCKVSLNEHLDTCSPDVEKRRHGRSGP